MLGYCSKMVLTLFSVHELLLLLTLLTLRAEPEARRAEPEARSAEAERVARGPQRRGSGPRRPRDFLSLFRQKTPISIKDFAVLDF